MNLKFISNKKKLIKDKNGVLTIHPMPNQNWLNIFYHKIYFQNNHGNYKKKYKKEELSFKEINAKIANFFLKKKSIILDVGCGEGNASIFFKKHGHICYATDVNDYAFKKNKINLKGINFQKSNFIENDFFIGKKFDVIYSELFAEHIINYYEFLRIAKKRLKKNGYFIMTIPNDLNKIYLEYLKRQKVTFIKSKIFNLEHLRYFNYNSLKRSVTSVFKKYKYVKIIAAYPMEQFLLNKNSDYYKNRNGKIYHEIRINFMNFITQKVDKKLINYLESMAILGIGRDLTLILKK